MSVQGPPARDSLIARTGVLRAVRAFPGLLRVSFADAVAYRAEFLVWMLSTTMPLIQMALMRAIALEAPVRGQTRTWGAGAFTAYYLAALFVRMLTGAWVVWEMSQEVRTGAFSMRLMRPVNPFVSWASDNLAAIPLRGAIAIPIVLTMLFLEPASASHDPWLWVLAAASIAGAWLINFLVNCAMASIVFYAESATSVFEVWLALWMIFSGYLFPLDLFPAWVRGVLHWLPFELMMDLPVRCMTGMISVHDALGGMARQGVWIAGLFVLAAFSWRIGSRRFSAVGG